MGLAGVVAEKGAAATERGVSRLATKNVRWWADKELRQKLKEIDLMGDVPASGGRAAQAHRVLRLVAYLR
jgi:hypothetical protein